jgi:Tfp pilus assembly protein PilN
MIQFNLLPDIKIQYLKAKRQEHAVVLGSVVAIIAAVTVLVLLLAVVYGLQKKSLSDLNTDIKSASSELQKTPELTKILTVQNQLNALPALHDQKAVTSRLFDYLSILTPSAASISDMTLDLEVGTLTISGSADSLTTVNKYVDNLKFTQYVTAENSSKKNAFSEVVLSNFTRDDKQTSYTISFKFDPIIFSGTDEPTLSVPSIISTRSEVDKPDALFQAGGAQ